MKMYVKKWLERRLEPPKPDYEVSMDIEIKKGQKEGRALIPCAINSFSHIVDLNPSLIKKERVETKLPTNKLFLRRKCDKVKLENNEKVKYKEVEPCPHCGQKVVISEVKETKYHSDPFLFVSLSTPATENVKIPVKFGLSKSEMMFAKYLALPLVTIGSFTLLYMLVNNFFSVLGFAFGLVALGFIIFTFYRLTLIGYNSIRFWKWWLTNKNNIKPIVR